MNRKVSVIALLLVASHAAVTAQTPPATTPVSPGVAAFKKMLESYGKLRGVNFVVWSGSRIGGADRYFNYSNTVEFWYQEGGIFRIDTSSPMGGGTRQISDGKQVLFDPMNIGSNLELRASGPTVAKAVPALDFGRGNACPLYSFLEGTSAYDRIVAEGADIKLSEFDRANYVLTIPSRGLGNLMLYYRKNDPLMLVRRIEWDRVTGGGGRGGGGGGGGQGGPGGGAPQPIPDSLFRQNIGYLAVNAKFPAGFFSTEPPKGVRVVDRRNAAPGADTGPFRPPEGEEEPNLAFLNGYL